MLLDKQIIQCLELSREVFDMDLDTLKTEIAVLTEQEQDALFTYLSEQIESKERGGRKA